LNSATVALSFVTEHPNLRKGSPKSVPKAVAMSIDRKIAVLHRRLGVMASIGFLIAAGTALLLNHRNLFLKPVPSGDGPYAQYLLSHARSPQDSKLVLVGTSNGAFLSRDEGASFTQLALPVPAQQVVGAQFDPTTPEKVYLLLRERGLFVSPDLGTTWKKVEVPLNTTLQSLQVGPSGSLSILTPQGLVWTRASKADAILDWQQIHRDPATQTADPGRTLLRNAFNLHDGNYWGQAATAVTDFVSISLIAITASGLWMARPRKSTG
jgi:hypothetical protein